MSLTCEFDEEERISESRHCKAMGERISGLWRKLQQTALGKFRRASLKQKLTYITSFTVTLILLYCFMIFITTIYSNNRREREEYLQSSFLQKKETLDAFLSRIDYTASIMFSNWVQNLMVSRRVASNAELQNYQRNVSHFLSSLTSINDNHSYILLSDSLMLWSNNALHYDTQYDISKQPWYEQLLHGKKYVKYGRSKLFAGLSDTWSMTMYYPVTNYFTFSRIGFLAVNITADKLKFLVEDGGNDIHGELALVKDQMNQTIVSNIPAGFSLKRGW